MDIYEQWKHKVRNNHEAWFEMLKEYCRGKTTFIRDFATKSGRYLVRDIGDVYDQMVRHCYELKKNVYISVYEFREIDGKLPDYGSYMPLDKVVFDIDLDENSSLMDGFQVSKDIIHTIRKDSSPLDRGRAKSRILYTGNGFHVYYIPSRPFRGNKEKRKLCEDVYEKLDEPDVIDRALFGDVARDIRIPYSIHPFTKRQMIPVQDTLEDTVEKAKSVSIPKQPLFR